jgi:hypothetical protein
MNTENPTSQPLPADASLADVMRRLLSLRAVHWDALVRAVLSVRAPDDLDARGDIVWDRVTPRDLEVPVTEASLRAWLSTAPPRVAVRWLGWLFDVRDPRAVTREDLVRLVAELYPDALVELFGGSPPHDPLVRGLYTIAGDRLGESCARALVANPHNGFCTTMQLATEGACVAYLRGTTEVMSPHEFGQLGHHLLKRSSVSEAVRAAYGEALVALVKRLTNKHAPELWVFTPLVDAKPLEEALRASTKRPKVWARLVTLVCAQGLPQGAKALAAMLGDKKLAGHAAAALASMGEVGANAARAWLDTQGAKPSRGAELARLLAALPPCATSLWAGDLYALPRFGRSPREDLFEAPLSVTTRHPPTPLAVLEAALGEKPVSDLLSPEGWADLLQIIALDPQLTNVAHAWQKAHARGLLGRGANPAAMLAALDTLHWDAVTTRHYPATSWGIGWVLLWAHAGRDVFRHAAARFELSAVVSYLGARERHFTKPLTELEPSWAPSMLCLLRHYGSERHETAWLGAPPVLAALTTPGATVELAAPSADLWIVGEVSRATRFTVTFRGNVALTVDVAAERWKVSGPAKAEGATPPLDAARGVRFAIETARDAAYVGIDGAIVHGALSKLPSKVASVTVSVEGEGAQVTSLTLHAKYTARAAEAVGELFSDLDAAQGYTEVAGQRSPEAAHCLAACALLLDEARATMARDALATMKGDGLDVWQRLGRDGVKVEAPSAKPAAAPTEFTVRSFEDVVRVFHDARMGVKAKSKKPAEFKRGQIERGDLEYASYGPKPAAEDWGARTAVPWPAVYLGEEAPDFDEVRYFVDALAALPALCRKGRGTHADVACVRAKGRYAIASMELMPANEEYDDGPWRVVGAAWKVDEGWAWALFEGPDEAILPLLGMKVLPPRVEWARADVTVGNW